MKIENRDSYRNISIDSRFGVTQKTKIREYKFCIVEWSIFRNVIRVDIILKSRIFGLLKRKNYELIIDKD